MRRLGKNRSRWGRGEYRVIGVGTLRAQRGAIYLVERPDGSVVQYDGVGLYEHELRPL